MLYCLKELDWRGDRTTMSIPMDLCSTEDHGYHLPE